MPRNKKFKLLFWLLFIIVVLISIFVAFWTYKSSTGTTTLSIGQKVDSLHGVYVYYNGATHNVSGRNKTKDGYNLGLKYQCVEFVKRYYYEHLNHKMPDSYGHAKDFFDKTLGDGSWNNRRALRQYTNPSKKKPKVNDLLVFSGTKSNAFGHVAIISIVTDHEVEIIQQNTGPNGNSRARFELEKNGSEWKIKNDRILGWLRKE